MFMNLNLPTTNQAIISFVVLALIIPCFPAFSAEFDIPLSELNIVKKKKTLHHELQKKRKHSRKYDKTVKAESTESNDKIKLTEIKEEIVTTDKIQKSPKLPSTIPKQSVSPEMVNSAIKEAKISHAPYSYILPERRTTIQAVISSTVPIAKVYCYFHAIGALNGAAVTMVKIDGTQFTYTATIPALSAGNRGLSYKIYVVDTNGYSTQSPNYEIPVSSTTVFPAWQANHFKEILAITIDDKKSILEGFSDPSIQPK